MTQRIFTAGSLFCGAGGLDIGFDRSGFRTIWANDFNADACKTHQLWSDAEVVCGDIGGVDTADIPDVDIMLGGFPCQGFSLSGPRKLDDRRNILYQHYVRIVKAKQPLMFVGENVKGLLTMGNGQIMDAIIQDFSDCGYDVYYQLLNAKDYDVPEDRERVIIVGFRKDLEICNFQYPDKHEHHILLRDVLAPISDPDASDVCTEPYSSRYMSRNRKRGWDNVSFTIPAMAKQVPLWPGSPDMVKVDKDHWTFGTNGVTRRLSWQEAAAVQTFPLNMTFAGDLVSKYKQIGNAVPCKLAEAMGHYLYDILLNAC